MVGQGPLEPYILVRIQAPQQIIYMKITKLTLLKFSLFLGALYYLIGGIVHFFGLNLFPFYVKALYSSYHDIALALAAFVLAIILFTVGRNPIKNIDVLNAIIISGFLAIIFSFYIIWKIDFIQIGAAAKKTQTIVELALLIIYVVALIILKPKSAERS
jgi:hypothetical protein